MLGFRISRVRDSDFLYFHFLDFGDYLTPHPAYLIWPDIRPIIIRD